MNIKIIPWHGRNKLQDNKILIMDTIFDGDS